MASSVAALQRLSASIDVTAVSRSNSRASAYEDNSSKDNNSETTAVTTQRETAAGEDGDVGGCNQRPQYLTANCVVYTFYSGDLTAAIDDHFNRALKRSNERDSPSANHSESAKQQSGM